MESDEAETVSSAESVTTITLASNDASATSIVSDVTEDVDSETEKSSSYSEVDSFHTDTWKRPPLITPRTPRTGRFTPSVAYSADFESATLTTARYSDDFESTTYGRSHSNIGRYSDDFESTTHGRSDSNIGRYSTESFQSSHSTLAYSHSFESYTASFESTETGSHSDSQEDTTLSATRSSDDVSSSPSRTYYSKTEDEAGDEDDDVSSKAETYSSDWSTEQSEVSETTKLAEESALSAFIARKIKALKGKPSQKPSLTPHHTPRPPVTPRIDKPLSEFCSKKLHILKKKNRYHGSETDGDDYLYEVEPRRRWSEVIANTQLKDWGVPRKKVEQLRWENFQRAMKNLKNAPIHEPRNCKECVEKMAEMEAREFIKQKFAIVSERCIEEKLTNPAFLYTDAIGVMGTHLKTFPRVDDEPDDIRERLMKPLIDNYISSARVPVEVADEAEKACGIGRDKFWQTFLKPLHEKEPYKSHYNPESKMMDRFEIPETFSHVGERTLWSESLQRVKQVPDTSVKSETESVIPTGDQYPEIGPFDIYSLHELDELKAHEDDSTVHSLTNESDHDVTAPTEDTSTASGSNILSFGQLQAIDELEAMTGDVHSEQLQSFLPANEDGNVGEGQLGVTVDVAQYPDDLQGGLDGLQCIMEGQQYDSDSTVTPTGQTSPEEASDHERFLRSSSIKFVDESLLSSHSDHEEPSHQYDLSSYHMDSINQNVFNIDELNLISIKEGGVFDEDEGGDIVSTEGSASLDIVTDSVSSISS